jgi:hypothetical protein
MSFTIVQYITRALRRVRKPWPALASIEYPPIGIPGGGVISIETAPAVATPVTSSFLTGGCVMWISWVDMHPQRDNETKATDIIRMIVLLPLRLDINGLSWDLSRLFLPDTYKRSEHHNKIASSQSRPFLFSETIAMKFTIGTMNQITSRTHSIGSLGTPFIATNRIPTTT